MVKWLEYVILRVATKDGRYGDRGKHREFDGINDVKSYNSFLNHF